MEHINYIAFALPAFFLFLYMEYKVAKHKQLKNIYKYEGSINNISIGIAERLLSLFITAGFYSLFHYIYENYALLPIPDTWYTWVLLILATDFIWYWYHRLGHEVNLLWAAHIVHHQSEEFNLTVAARITVFQALIRNVFWCLLPFAGFPPSLVIFILLLHGVYSFFTHTQVVGKLGWLEHVFITPSLHGVHHASDHKYLDKNYGDIFVFWDKLFGTFKREEEKPAYGLTHPIKSYSFLWQHFHYYLEIWEAAKRAKGLSRKLRAIFGSPALMDQDIRPMLENRWLPKQPKGLKRKEPNSPSLRIYLNVQITVSFILTCLITYFFGTLGQPERIFGSFFIIATLIICGGLMERHSWIFHMEYFRLLTVANYMSVYSGYPALSLIAIVIMVLIERHFKLGRKYKRFVLRVSPNP